MKKFLAVVVALGLCGLYWLGCQKKQATETAAPETEIAQPEEVTPPPPPPPAPEAPVEGEKAE
ncbi:MAG: hypothetical protein JXA24_01695 [Proteobacteria bacterium]|nr:hypothetical protein [Pseudomonadota bacterium]